MTDSRAPARTLSVVVPCYNEGEGLRRVHERLTSALGDLPETELELIYVDDGSRDSTLDVLRDLQRTDSRTRVLSFSRNFGKDSAVTAGIDHSSGDVVAFIDADLQEPPEVVLEMLERWRAGADVVYGVRASRKHDSLGVRWSAAAYSRLHDWLVRDQRLHHRCDFHLFTREVADALKAMPERGRMHRSMIAWLGFRQEAVYFARPDRQWGRSKLGFRRRLGDGTRSILATSAAPLRLALLAGLLAGGASVALGVYAVGSRALAGEWPPSWTIAAALAMFLVGAQFVFMGIVGEYVGAVFRQVQGRPLYLVQDKVGFSDDDVASGRQGLP